MMACSRCGATFRDPKRLFELEPDVWACRWQFGCDHRIESAETTIHRLSRLMDELTDVVIVQEYLYTPPTCWNCHQENHLYCINIILQIRSDTERDCYCSCSNFGFGT